MLSNPNNTNYNFDEQVKIMLTASAAITSSIRLPAGSIPPGIIHG